MIPAHAQPKPIAKVDYWYPDKEGDTINIYSTASLQNLKDRLEREKAIYIVYPLDMNKYVV